MNNDLKNSTFNLENIVLTRPKKLLFIFYPNNKEKQIEIRIKYLLE